MRRAGGRGAHDAGARVEGQEDERVGRHVFVDALVEPPVRVEQVRVRAPVALVAVRVVSGRRLRGARAHRCMWMNDMTTLRAVRESHVAAAARGRTVCVPAHTAASPHRCTASWG